MKSQVFRRKMFVRVFLFVCVLECMNALQRGDLEKYGPFHIIVNSRIMTCKHTRNENLDVRGIKIYFFDFANNFNKTFPISDAAKGIRKIKNLDKTRKFVLFIGGFKSHIDESVEKQMIEAYKVYPNSYLIIPDHSAYTNDYSGHGVKNYKRSVSYVFYIGKALGQMLADLSFSGVSPKNIHCVGHSLGGQILGFVGSTFFNVTNEKISRITALDPAGPCFVNGPIDEQVRSGVADYVEIYHCNAGELGSSNILGDIDFFMNKNGKMNPNCKSPLIPDLIRSSKAASCNHRICVDVWTASIKHPTLFPAYSCESYNKFKKGECVNNTQTIAGSSNPCTARGEYYFSTEKYNLIALA